MLTKTITIMKNTKNNLVSFTVPNPVFGREKVNGEVFIVFSDDAVVVGILKLKLDDDIKLLVAVVVVVVIIVDDLLEEDDDKDKFVVALVVGLRNSNEDVVT